MRVIFMGTPEFAVPSLHYLAQKSNNSLIAVVTTIDKPSGRGQLVSSSPVKMRAEALQLPVIQVLNLKDEVFLQNIKLLNPDIFVVVAFRMLPIELYSIPKLGAINLHASLLPYYRGPAPIQWTLINGETRTGVTTFQIDAGIDTGNILLQEAVDILPDETAGELSERLAEIGARLVVKTLDQFKSGTLTPQKQIIDIGSRAPKITPEMGLLNWNKSASAIVNLIRGLSPKPAAYTFFNDMKLKLYRAKIADICILNAPPGYVIESNPKKGLIVQAGEGAVEIISVQREGKKTITACELLRGIHIPEGSIFL